MSRPPRVERKRPSAARSEPKASEGASNRKASEVERVGA